MQSYFQSLTQKQKIWHFSVNPNACSFAYDRLKMHLNAARTQAERIALAQHAGAALMPPSPNMSNAIEVKDYFERCNELYNQLFIEIHFYFVAWVNCGSMLKVFSAQPDYKEASMYFGTVKKHFDFYGEARNSFEHFHDRLPGGKNERVVKEMRESDAGRKVYQGWKDGKYLFSDKEWDVSWESYQLLQKIVFDFLDLVRGIVDQRCREFILSLPPSVPTSQV